MTTTAPANAATSRKCPSCRTPDALRSTAPIGASIAEAGMSSWECSSCGAAHAELPLMDVAELIDLSRRREVDAIATYRSTCARLAVLESFDMYRGAAREPDYGHGQREKGLCRARAELRAAGERFTEIRRRERVSAGELAPAPADLAAAYNHEVRRKARRHDVHAVVLETLEHVRLTLELEPGEPFELVAGSYLAPGTAPALHYAREVSQ